MKVTSTGLVLALVLGVHSSIVNTKQELICNNPENPNDCYPKLFEPTTEWQLIKKDQDIPPGLHVRLNIDTLEREAKLMDPSEEDSSNQELVVTDVQVEEHDLQQQVEELQRKKMHQKIEEFKGKERAKRVDSDELSNYQGAVEEIEQYDGDAARLDQALNTLVELSHDIEFGVKLTATPQIFQSFQNVIDSTSDTGTHEKIYRIMGSALRNNPEAVNNVLSGFSGDFVVELFGLLSNKSTPDLVQKRVLGIVQALNQNPHFNLKYFNVDNDSNNQGIVLLLKNYPSYGEQTKARVLALFEDIKLVKNDNLKNDRSWVENAHDPDHQISLLLQDSLAENKVASNEQFKQYFKSLSEIHSENKSLKPTSDFMNWLAKEVEVRKEYKKRDDYPAEDAQFDSEMLKARHEIFGNPKAMRKAIADEL